MSNEGKVLSAQDRTSDFGSAGSRRVLRAGRIPAVIYGKSNTQPIHITLDAKEFTLKMRHFTDTSLLTINVGDKSYECLMKDYQDDLLHDQIKHVDFYQVTRGQKLRTEMVPVMVAFWTRSCTRSRSSRFPRTFRTSWSWTFPTWS